MSGEGDRDLAFHHPNSELVVLHQECTAIFSQWKKFVTIFTNTALQPPLIFSGAEISDTATLTDVRGAELCDLNISAVGKKRRITFQ